MCDPKVINSSAIKNITRSGVTFTATRLNNGTFTFTQQDSNTTYANFKGSTTSANGTAGLVPAPGKAAASYYLRNDGGWYIPPNTTYVVATTSASGLMAASDRVALNTLNSNSGQQVLNSTYKIYYRKYGHIVHLYCWNNTSLNIAAATALGTLPAGYRPTASIFIPIYGSYGSWPQYIPYIQLSSSGALAIGTLAVTGNPLLFSTVFIVD